MSWRTGMTKILMMILVIALVVATASCKPAEIPLIPPEPTTQTTTAPAPFTPPPIPVGTDGTFGQLADAGALVFAARCAPCHGDLGQGNLGPALIGENAGFDDYGTAQGLLNFISIAMPQDAPGSLTREEYLHVLSFLLVSNKYASPTVTFGESKLQRIIMGDG